MKNLSILSIIMLVGLVSISANAMEREHKRDTPEGGHINGQGAPKRARPTIPAGASPEEQLRIIREWREQQDPNYQQHVADQREAERLAREEAERKEQEERKNREERERAQDEEIEADTELEMQLLILDGLIGSVECVAQAVCKEKDHDEIIAMLVVIDSEIEASGIDFDVEEDTHDEDYIEKVTQLITAMNDLVSVITENGKLLIDRNFVRILTTYQQCVNNIFTHIGCEPVEWKIDSETPELLQATEELKAQLAAAEKVRVDRENETLAQVEVARLEAEEKARVERENEEQAVALAAWLEAQEQVRVEAATQALIAQLQADENAAQIARDARTARGLR